MIKRILHKHLSSCILPWIWLTIQVISMSKSCRIINKSPHINYASDFPDNARMPSLPKHWWLTCLNTYHHMNMLQLLDLFSYISHSLLLICWIFVRQSHHLKRAFDEPTLQKNMWLINLYQFQPLFIFFHVDHIPPSAPCPAVFCAEFINICNWLPL